MRITEKYREVKKRAWTGKRKIKETVKNLKQARNDCKTVVSPIQQSAECSSESPLRFSNHSQTSILDEDLLLDKWKIPIKIIENYNDAGVSTMFKWQAECLLTGNVLEGKNLVYSAPTSAGKTFVSEILMLKTIIEKKKKVIMILPFVSIVREKVKYLKNIFCGEGLYVDGFMGNYTPPGGLDTLDLAVGTIEKINNLINRIIESKSIDDIGMIVIDELHLIGDKSRGYLLELLLSKLQYLCHKSPNLRIQIVAMSATLPNLTVLAQWLDAELYSTDFRPIPLETYVKIGCDIYNKHREKIRTLHMDIKDDQDGVFQLCLETIIEGFSVLVFCPTKNWCESLAESLSRHIFLYGRTEVDESDPRYDTINKLRANIDADHLSDILGQLRSCPAGLDASLQRCINFGVAYHHAGLTMDEREIVESSFREGQLKVLCATTTLSSGVNLPARRVIVRSPMFHGLPIDQMTFHQMMGRAGRKGIDTQGESIVICKETEKEIGYQLLMADIPPVMSSMVTSDNKLNNTMKRALLELIVNGLALTLADIETYSSFTLITRCSSAGTLRHTHILQCLSYLVGNLFIREQKQDNESLSYTPTQLGIAALSSGMSPDDSLEIFNELSHARMSFALDTDLHIIYQVIPPNISRQAPGIDWLNFLTCLESLEECNKRVARLVGVEESFIVKAMKGNVNVNSEQSARKLAVHQRFFVALALNDLVNEVPLGRVAAKYGFNRGLLQNLQQSAASFAGMVTIFCNKLGWSNLEVLIQQFQPRLFFGIHRELCDLVKLPDLNGKWARVLYSAGITNLTDLANSRQSFVENVLHNGKAFQASEAIDVNKSKVIYLSNDGPGYPHDIAAGLLIRSAREYIQASLGKNILWQDSSSLESDNNTLSPKTSSNNEHNTARNYSVVDNAITTLEDIVSSSTNEKSPNLLISVTGDEIDRGISGTDSTPIISADQAHLRMMSATSADGSTPTTSTSTITGCSSELAEEGKVRLHINSSSSCRDSAVAQDTLNDTSFFINTQEYDALMSGPILKSDNSGFDPCFKSVSEENNDYEEEDLFQLSNRELEHLTSERVISPYRSDSRLSDLHVNSDKSNNSETDIFADSSWLLASTAPGQGMASPIVYKARDSLHPKVGLTPTRPDAFGMGTTLSASILDDIFGKNCDLSTSCNMLPKVVSTSVEFSMSAERNVTNRASTPCKSAFTRLKPRKPSLILGDDDCIKDQVILSDSSVCPNLSRTAYTELDRELGNDQFDNPGGKDNYLNPDASFTHRRISLAVDDSDESCEDESIFDTSTELPLPKERTLSQSPSASNRAKPALYSQREITYPVEGLVILEPDKSVSTWKAFKKQWFQQKIFSLSLLAEGGAAQGYGCPPLKKKSPIGLARRLKNRRSKTGADGSKDTTQYETNSVLKGYSVAWGSSVYFIACQASTNGSLPTAQDKQTLLKQRLETANKCSIILNPIRSQYRLIINELGIKLHGHHSLMDPAVGDWILDSETNSYDLPSLVLKYLPANHPVVTYLEQCPNYLRASHDVKHLTSINGILALKVMDTISEMLKDRELMPYFLECEMPINVILADMESHGIGFDPTVCDQLSTRISELKSKLEEAIYKEAGCNFNLASTKAVRELLYCRLNLPATKFNERFKDTAGMRIIGGESNVRASGVVNVNKNKKYFPTNKAALNILSGHHIVPRLLLQWRKLSSGLSMVINPLKREEKLFVDKTHYRDMARMPTKYCTRHATGRITMYEPNVQNIPRDLIISLIEDNDPQVISFRSMFIPPKDGLFVAADYRQLELRILAHLSQDAALISSLTSEGDIFCDIASKWLNIPANQVTDEKRQLAKQITYGIIYGMGNKTLSEHLKLSEAQAEQYKAVFNQKFPGVQQFIDETIEICKKVGYIETIGCRRRYFNNITSEHKALQDQAFRQAINSTVQGSAADIVKLAMSDIQKEFMSLTTFTAFTPNLVLHLHDELIFEVPENILNDVIVIIRTCMERSYQDKMLVPLPVKIRTGKSWGTLEEQ